MAAEVVVDSGSIIILIMSLVVFSLGYVLPTSKARHLSHTPASEVIPNTSQATKAVHHKLSSSCPTCHL